MKKFIKVFVLLTTMMFSFMLTSCFNGGSSNPSNKTRRAKLEEVKELITEFHLYENLIPILIFMMAILKLVTAISSLIVLKKMVYGI